jgi:CelD/BcsL family acetyltransferase involved in cellulose biosynthesis
MNTTIDSLRNAGAVTVQVATSVEALEPHAAAWDRLAVTGLERMPMLSHAWVASYLEHGNPDRAPWRCLLAYRGADLVGVMTLLRTRGQLRDRLLAPEDDHTIVGHPLLALDGADEALAALVEAALDLEPRLWMRFYGIRATSPVLAVAPVLHENARVLPTPGYLGCSVDTAGAYEEFQSRLSSSFRRSLRSARKKLERDHRLTFDFVSGPEAAAPELMADFLRVEASGWKGAAGSAIACDTERTAFYAALARRLSARGWLEWNLARVDGRLVAAHFGLRFGRAVVLPKGGYDEAFAAFAPGNLLFWELFARAFADADVDEVNFLTDKPWMRLWKMRAESYTGLVVTPRGPLATFSGLVAASEPRRRVSDYAREHPELLTRVEDTKRWLRQARLLR